MRIACRACSSASFGTSPSGPVWVRLAKCARASSAASLWYSAQRFQLNGAKWQALRLSSPSYRLVPSPAVASSRALTSPPASVKNSIQCVAMPAISVPCSPNSAPALPMMPLRIFCSTGTTWSRLIPSAADGSGR